MLQRCRSSTIYSIRVWNVKRNVNFGRLHNQNIATAKYVLGFDSVETGKLDPVELKRAYYMRAKQCHPDSAAEGKQDPVLFNRLAEAYALLKECIEPGRMETPAAPTDSSSSSSYNSDVHARQLWAKLFYGSIADEMHVDSSVLAGLRAAAELSAGGLDRGGMWQLARDMERNLRASSVSGVQAANVNAYVDVGPAALLETGAGADLGGNPHSPKPFSRKRR